ncbi:IS3 family transposase [Candidatus Bipolaricaulota bacterium]|nr:IS3 family transposase [Candidatus Bipolaricaulota bacterium]
MKDKYDYLKPLIRKVIEKFPEYGRPRITRELQEKYGIEVNHKVVGKLLRQWDMTILRAARKTSKSPIERAIERVGSDANLAKKRLQSSSPVELFEIAYTDFTGFEYAGGTRSAKLMAIIGHTSKLIIGWAPGKSRNKVIACRAWERSRETFDRLSVDWTGLIMHQDQDSVYKSNRWVDQLLEDQLKISYSTNGAKDNTYMESFNGHFKNPIKSILNGAETTREVKEVIEKRVMQWNQERRHSSLGQTAPITYIKQEIRD